MCKAAGAIIHFDREDFKVDYKADNSPITMVDLVTNRTLKGTLTNDFGDHGWLSEEKRDDSNHLNCERVWIVDPVDGTGKVSYQITT